MEGHWKFLGGGGGVLTAKIVEAMYEATFKLEFPRGRCKTKTLLWGVGGGSMEIFWNCAIAVAQVISQVRF